MTDKIEGWDFETRLARAIEAERGENGFYFTTAEGDEDGTFILAMRLAQRLRADQ